MNLQILVQIRLLAGKVQRAGLWGHDTVQAGTFLLDILTGGLSDNFWCLRGEGGVPIGGGDEEWILVG